MVTSGCYSLMVSLSALFPCSAEHQSGPATHIPRTAATWAPKQKLLCQHRTTGLVFGHHHKNWGEGNGPICLGLLRGGCHRGLPCTNHEVKAFSSRQRDRLLTPASNVCIPSGRARSLTGTLTHSLQVLSSLSHCWVELILPSSPD